MFFAWDILVLAGTTEAEPKTQVLKLSKGIITKIDVKFAPGCHTLVKVRLFRYESQLVPLSGDEWVTGDGEAVKTEGYYELLETPAHLKFIACSPNTRYNHTITVRVSIEPPEVAAPWQVIRDFIDIIKQLIGL